jgi:hypothetical protein
MEPRARREHCDEWRDELSEFGESHEPSGPKSILA